NSVSTFPLNDRFGSSLVLLPLALLMEVPIMTMTGGTLGKWLFRISVRNSDGARLAISQIFRRNLGVWIRGFGLGLPLVNLCCLAQSYSDVDEECPAAWDKAAGTRVYQPKLSRLRFCLGAFLYAVLFAGFSLAALVK